MNATQWIHKLQHGEYNSHLEFLYGHAQTAIPRYTDLLKNYVNLFGDEDLTVLSAPGRTELAGNHTDHQLGRVLCAAIHLDTLAAVAPARDNTITLISEGFGETKLSLDQLQPVPEEIGTTAALIRGVAAALRDMGYKTGGFRAYITSQIPGGGGLSSSAAFEILVGAIFSALYNNRSLSPVQLAEAGYQAENRYFGKPCGRMDQMACALGGIQMIDFYDPVVPAVTGIDFDFRSAGYVLCVVDSHTDHADLTADYAAIPQDMATVAAFFHQKYLRYVNLFDFSKALPQLERELPKRCINRAAHFFEEDRRVGQMAAVLSNRNVEAYRAMMQLSGNSSRWQLGNIVPPSQPERRGLETALERCKAALGGQGAYRVHGGGFAGYVQCLVPAEHWEGFRTELEGHYGVASVTELRIRPVGSYIF